MPQEIDERTRKLIFRYVGVKSARAISEELGVPVDDVLRVRNEFKDEIDVLTVEQKQHKLLVQLEEVAMTMREKLDDPGLEQRNVAGVANALTTAVKAASTEMRKIEATNSSAVDTLNRLRVRELVSLLQEVVDVSVISVAEQHGLDADDLFAVFNDNLQKAAQRRDALS